MLKKVFKLQLTHSTRGDWAHTCVTDLKELRIFETLDEIKVMSEHRYATLLNNRIRENALKYLKDKQRSKGKNIHYEEIQMAEYLLPINTKLSIEQKQKMFALKNRMVELPENFPGRKMDDKCFATSQKLLYTYINVKH